MNSITAVTERFGLRISDIPRFPQPSPAMQQEFFRMIRNPWKGFAVGKAVAFTGQLFGLLQRSRRFPLSPIGGAIHYMTLIVLKSEVDAFKQPNEESDDPGELNAPCLGEQIDLSLIGDAFCLFANLALTDEEETSTALVTLKVTLLALTGICGLVQVGCANRDREKVYRLNSQEMMLLSGVSDEDGVVDI